MSLFFQWLGDPIDLPRRLRGRQHLMLARFPSKISPFRAKYENNQASQPTTETVKSKEICMVYTSPDDTLPIMVHFSYLESKLIPFGDPIKHSKDGSKGRVPSCDYTDVNTDPSLYGFECFLDSAAKARPHPNPSKYLSAAQ